MRTFKAILISFCVVVLLLGTAFGITYAVDKDLALSWIGIEKEEPTPGTDIEEPENPDDTKEPETPEEPDDPSDPVILEYEFSDNILLSYSGDDTDITIPSSYSRISELSEKVFSEDIDLFEYLSFSNSTIEYPITVTDSTAQKYELFSEHDVLINRDITYPVTMPAVVYTFIEGNDYDVTEIGQYAFDSNDAIVNVLVPACITKIGRNAFDSCINLESVIFEENSNINDLGNLTFYRCAKLKNVDFGGNNQLEIIGQQSFSGCKLLEKVDLKGNNKLKKIDFGLFSGCSALQEFIIPSSVTEISGNALSGCKALTSIIIPSNVTIIRESAFNSCTNLTEVVLESQTPPTLGDNVFVSCSEDLTIYVPEESVEAYKTDKVWINVADKIQAIPEASVGDDEPGDIVEIQ